VISTTKRNWIFGITATLLLILILELLLRVAVNLSAKQFIQPDLTQRIMTILKEEQLAPKHLELEITEGVVMEDPERAIEIMTELHNCGIHLALDDFGTGYSSLAYLKRLTLSMKI